MTTHERLKTALLRNKKRVSKAFATKSIKIETGQNYLAQQVKDQQPATGKARGDDVRYQRLLSTNMSNGSNSQWQTTT